ncbi:hypothetical protein F9K79_12820 [Ochrobactrum sp. Kaboul]|nr:hypothetical protein F9K79_12820 [Ochrobactrum sp. Kaboul]
MNDIKLCNFIDCTIYYIDKKFLVSSDGCSDHSVVTHLLLDLYFGDFQMPELLLEDGVPARVDLEFDVDPLDAAGAMLSYFVGLIPVVGSLLSTLVTIFWPKHSEDVWAQIKQEVKTLVDEEIDESEWAILQGRIAECGDKVRKFCDVLKSGDKEHAQILYKEFTGYFIGLEENFKIKGHQYQYFFSPAYCALVNIIIAFRIEVIHNGEKFSLSEKYIEYEKDVLSNLIESSKNYISSVKEKHNDYIKKALESGGNADYYNSLFKVNHFFQASAIVYLQIWDIEAFLKKKDIEVDLALPGLIIQIPWSDSTHDMMGPEICQSITPALKDNHIKSVTLAESEEYDHGQRRPTGLIVSYESHKDQMGYLGRPRDIQVCEQVLDCSTNQWDHLSKVRGEWLDFVYLLTLETDAGKSVTIGHNAPSWGDKASFELKWPYRVGKIFVPDDRIGYYNRHSGHQMGAAGFGVIYDNALAKESAKRLKNYFLEVD